MYEQVHDPVGGSLGLSTLFAVLPLVTLFVLLAGLRLRAYRASLIALAVAVTVAIAVYGMPAGQAFNSAAAGAAFGIFPIVWIVVNAVWIYTMTVATGHFHTLRRGVGAASGDQRIQALMVAFSFGALLEALAGFGAPVAITVGMLIALGFEPLKAAGVALIGNTAPAAFGAIATPIITLSGVTGISERDLGAMVGRQLPFLALLVPLVIVYIVDGRRGLRETWRVALLAGSAFAVAQFVTSNYVSVELTDVVASLASMGAIAGYLRWQRQDAVRRGILSRDDRGARALSDPDRDPHARAGRAGQRLSRRSNRVVPLARPRGDDRGRRRAARGDFHAQLARDAGDAAAAGRAPHDARSCASGLVWHCAPTRRRSSAYEGRSSRSPRCWRSRM